MKLSTYKIWMRYTNDRQATPWRLTSHSVNARSEKEAQSKLARMFKGAGFHSMSLVAVIAGANPNQPGVVQ